MKHLRDLFPNQDERIYDRICKDGPSSKSSYTYPNGVTTYAIRGSWVTNVHKVTLWWEEGGVRKYYYVYCGDTGLQTYSNGAKAKDTVEKLGAWKTKDSMYMFEYWIATGEMTTNINAAIKAYRLEFGIDKPEEPSKPEETANDWLGIRSFLKELLQGLGNILTNAISSMGSAIGSALSTVFDWLKKPIEQITEAIGAIGAALTAAKNALFDLITTGFAKVVGFFETFIDKVRGAFEEAFKWIAEKFAMVVDFIKDIGTQIYEALKSAWSFVSENVKAIATEVWNWIKGFGNAMWGQIKAMSEGIYNALKNAWEAVKNAFINVKDAVVEALKNVVEWVKDKIKAIIDALVEGLDAFKTIMLDIWADFKSWLEDNFKVDKEKMAQHLMDYFETQIKVMDALSQKYIRSGE